MSAFLFWLCLTAICCVLGHFIGIGLDMLLVWWENRRRRSR